MTAYIRPLIKRTREDRMNILFAVIGAVGALLIVIGLFYDPDDPWRPFHRA